VKPLLKIGFLVVSVLLFASVTAAYQLTLAWDANTEPDLEGYILYGREWSPCPPYDYIATYPVTELTEPLNPRCKVTDLEKDVIYFLLILVLTVMKKLGRVLVKYASSWLDPPQLNKKRTAGFTG
jgi:hypothetical protein